MTIFSTPNSVLTILSEEIGVVDKNNLGSEEEDRNGNLGGVNRIPIYYYSLLTQRKIVLSSTSV